MSVFEILILVRRPAALSSTVYSSANLCGQIEVASLSVSPKTAEADVGEVEVGLEVGLEVAEVAEVVAEVVVSVKQPECETLKCLTVSCVGELSTDQVEVRANPCCGMLSSGRPNCGNTTGIPPEKEGWGGAEGEGQRRVSGSRLGAHQQQQQQQQGSAHL
jgi:hypothetical protein